VNIHADIFSAGHKGVPPLERLRQALKTYSTRGALLYCVLAANGAFSDDRIVAWFLKGIANGDENGFIAAHECQKRITIDDERFRLNPLELLPEKVREVCHFGIVQSEASIIVDKGPDFPCRQLRFRNVTVAKRAKVVW